MPGVWHLDQMTKVETMSCFRVPDAARDEGSICDESYRERASKKRKNNHDNPRICRLRKRCHPNPPLSSPLLSTLERLPLELLEQILVESGNVSLMHTSGYLFRTLSSDRCKKGLVLHCLHSYDTGFAGDVGFTEFQPASQMEKNTPVENAKRDAITANASLRDLRRLLEQSWVTMPLVKCVIKDWTWKLATAELRDFIKSSNLPAGDYYAALPELRTVLDKTTTNMLASDWQYFHSAANATRLSYTINDDDIDSDCDFSFSWPPVCRPVGAAGRLKMFFLENAYLNVTPLGHITSQVLRKCPTTSSCHAVHVFERRFIPWRLPSQDVLPARLLCGPWTQDRGDLLKFLLDACEPAFPGLTDLSLLENVGVTLSPHQEAAAQAGVLAALRENCELAIHTLVPRNMVNKGLWNYPNWPAAFCAADIEVRARGTGTAAPLDPWVRLSWNQEVAPSLGVRLTTDILRECVAPGKVEMHPELSVLVLRGLLESNAQKVRLPPGFMARMRELAWDRSRGWEERIGGGQADEARLRAEKFARLHRAFVERGLEDMPFEWHAGKEGAGVGVQLQGADAARVLGADVSLYVSQRSAVELERGYRCHHLPETGR